VPADRSQAGTTAKRISANLPSPIEIELTTSDSGGKPAWLSPLITGLFSFLGSMLVLVAALGNTSRTVRTSLKASESLIHQKANEAELERIRRSLSEFYGPYLQRSEENRLLIGELRARQADPTAFRTLTALQDPAWCRGLSMADRTLVQEIVANGEALRELIRGKAGFVDPALQEHFARAATHFRLLSLAQAGALRDPERFARYVYPRELDGALRVAVAHLETRANALRSNPSHPHGLMDALVIPKEYGLPAWPQDDAQHV